MSLPLLVSWVLERKIDLIEHHPPLAKLPTGMYVGREVNQDCLIFGQTLEQKAKDYSVLDVVVIEEGIGQNFALVPGIQRALPEYFSKEIVHELRAILEGYPIGFKQDATKGEDEDLSHPSVEHSQDTPFGDIREEIGFLQNLWIETVQEGQSTRDRLRGQLVLNDSPLAMHARAIIKSRIERQSKYIPGPSINGQMLWVVENIHTNGAMRQVLAAKHILSMRGAELVSRAAAGGMIYAVMEAVAMKTYLELLQAYCAQKGITFDANAQDAKTLLASITDKDQVLAGLETITEAEATTALSNALGIVVPPPAGEPQKVTEPLKAAATKTTEPLKAAATKTTEPPKVPDAPKADLTDPLIPDTSVLGDQSTFALGMQAMQQVVLPMQQAAQKNANDIAQLVAAVTDLTTIVNKKVIGDGKGELVRHVQESVQGLLPEQIKALTDGIASGMFTDQKTLDAQIEITRAGNAAYRKQVQQSFKDLPVSAQSLGFAFDNFTMSTDEDRKPVLAAKLLFKCATESERKEAQKAGVVAFRSLPQMFDFLCPGADPMEGIPFRDNEAKREQWRQRVYSKQVLLGTTLDGKEVTMAADFANVFLTVVGQVGMARWSTLDKSFLDICAEGTDFSDFVDSSIVISGAAPDIGVWSEEAGYPELTGGAKLPVTKHALLYGGIMKWSWIIVVNNQISTIQNDVIAQTEACWRVFGKAITNLLMGWGTGGINTMTWNADNGVFYDVKTRRNTVAGDGRTYTSLVGLQNLMMSAYDIAKPGYAAEMMTLNPGLVVCVKNSWGTVSDMYTMKGRPGDDTQTNELRIPNPPRVIGLHPGFLHNRDDYVAMIPAPSDKPIIEVCYMNGQKSPSLVWQEKPSEGRAYTHGELSVRYHFPLQHHMLRPHGAFAAWNK